MVKGTNLVIITLRTSKDIMDELRLLAKDDKCSTNKEIVKILYEYLDKKGIEGKWNQ